MERRPLPPELRDKHAKFLEREARIERNRKHRLQPAVAPSARHEAQQKRRAKERAARSAKENGLGPQVRTANREAGHAKTRAYWADPARRQAARERAAEIWADPAKRQLQAERGRQRMTDPEVLAAAEAGRARYWTDPVAQVLRREKVKVSAARRRDRAAAHKLGLREVLIDEMLRDWSGQEAEDLRAELLGSDCRGAILHADGSVALIQPFFDDAAEGSPVAVWLK